MKKEINWTDKSVVISSDATELENAKSVIERLSIKVNLGILKVHIIMNYLLFWQNPWKTVGKNS